MDGPLKLYTQSIYVYMPRLWGEVLGFNQILKEVNDENTLVQFMQLQIFT